MKIFKYFFTPYRKLKKTCEFVNNVRKPHRIGLQRHFNFCECAVNVFTNTQKGDEKHEFKTLSARNNL